MDKQVVDLDFLAKNGLLTTELATKFEMKDSNVKANKRELLRYRLPTEDEVTEILNDEELLDVVIKLQKPFTGALQHFKDRGKALIKAKLTPGHRKVIQAFPYRAFICDVLKDDYIDMFDQEDFNRLKSFL